MKHIKKFEKYDNNFFDKLKNLISLTFYKCEYEKMHVWNPKPVSSDKLKISMELIGDGTLEYYEYKSTWKYKTNLTKDIYMIVFGSISKPVMTNGYYYEIIINQKTGPYNITSLLRTSTGQTVYFDETTISKVCNVIKDEFLLRYDVDKYNL